MAPCLPHQLRPGETPRKPSSELSGIALKERGQADDELARFTEQKSETPPPRPYRKKPVLTCQGTTYLPATWQLDVTLGGKSKVGPGMVPELAGRMCRSRDAPLVAS